MLFVRSNIVSPVGSRLKPLKKAAHTAGGEGNPGVRCAIVEANSIPVWPQGVSARKDNIIHVTALLVGLLRTEDPFVAALQTDFRRLQIKQSESQSVYRPGGGLAHA